MHLKKIWLYKDKNQSEFSYVYYGFSDGPYGFDRNEVEKLQAFDCEKLLKGEYKGYNILPHVIRYIKDLKDIWMDLKK